MEELGMTYMDPLSLCCTLPQLLIPHTEQVRLTEIHNTHINPNIPAQPMKLAKVKVVLVN